tara:strand:- start:16069 stop:17331 length:1263 start_codon:yes stop_codon:yes gene_type:complete
VREDKTTPGPVRTPGKSARATDLSDSATIPWRTVTLLALGAFASSGMTRVLDPLLPRLEHDFGVSLGQAAWTITAFATAYGLMQLLYGPLADRRGKLRVMSVAAALAALASLACVLARDSLTVFIIARAAAGAFCAASIPLAMAWIGDAIPYDQRQDVLARFMIGQMIGMASGQVLGGLAAEQSFWAWPFLFYAAVFAVVAVLLGRQREPSNQVPKLAGHPGQALLDVLRQPWARVILFVAFVESLCFLGAFTFQVAHLHKVGGASLALAGTTMVAFSLGGVAFAFLARRWVRRLGETRLAIGGTLLASASMAMVAVQTSLWVAAPAIFVSGIGFYMLHNTLQTNATQMMPARRGAAVALFATCFFLGQSAGVALLGIAADHLGTRPVLLFGATMLVPIGLWLGWRLHLRHQPPPTPAAE